MPDGGPIERVEVVVVGGGPAGAALAARLAGTGDTTSSSWNVRRRGAGGRAVSSPRQPRSRPWRGSVSIRTPWPRWPGRSPRCASRRPAGRPSASPTAADDGGPPAVGFDRSTLDPRLLDLARGCGASVRSGWTVTGVDPDARQVVVHHADGIATLRADVIVGADGLRSVVARAAGVTHDRRDWRRGSASPTTSRTQASRDRETPGCAWSATATSGSRRCPASRVNVGIVLGRSWRDEVARRGARTVADELVAAIPAAEDDPAAWRSGIPTDAVAGAWPIGHRVTRRAGRGLAAGRRRRRLPRSVHRGRAPPRARLGRAGRRGDRGAGRAGGPARSPPTSARCSRRFLAKDAVSWLVQAFLARPALFEYAARRVASRPSVRATMGLVMGDLVPAGRALDPRYLAALLAP